MRLHLSRPPRHHLLLGLAVLSLGLVLPLSAGRGPLGESDGFEPSHPGSLPEQTTPPQIPAEDPPDEEPADAPGPSQNEPITITTPPQRAERLYAEDHIVAEFASNLPDWQRRQIAQAAGGVSFKSLSGGRLHRVGIAEGDEPLALVNRLAGLPGVIRAERDPIAYGLATQVQLATRRNKQGFSDPFFPAQWELARIRLAEARDINPTDGEGVIVAVIDSGVASGSGSTYPSRRGLDLEGVRFLPGLDLVSGGPPLDRGVQLSQGSPFLFGHGTFVAAQIAAAVNNGVGGGSVAPRVTILPIRVIGVSNFGLFSDIAAGIDFAVAQGAKVINMSLGGRGTAGFMQEAVSRAHRAGVVIVASAGNDAAGSNPPEDVLFPARYPEVIAVGATSFDDDRAAYSNRGAGLDISAPAGSNSSRVVGPGQRDAALSPTLVFDLRNGQATYALFWSNGTSFAAPQVAGAAALFIALGIDDPEIVRSLLLDNAVDLGARGRDNDTGTGRLDLRRSHRGIGFSF